MKNQINVLGKWSVRGEWIKAARGSRVQYGKWGVTIITQRITQKGQEIEMNIEGVKPPVTGILKENEASMNSYSYEEQGGTTTVSDFIVTFSEDGNSASSADKWIWKDNRRDNRGRCDDEPGTSIASWTRIE
jgi:hypothetical protein